MAFTDNLLAYWTFDDSSWSDSLNNNQFRLYQNGDGVSVGSGVLGGDANFNGDGVSYITSGVTAGQILPSGVTQLSISIWVNSTNGFFAIDSASGNNFPNSGPSFGTYNNGQFSVFVNDDASSDVVNGDGSINLTDGNWHNIIGTWNQFGSISIYIDGMLKGQVASSGNAINGNILNPFCFNSNGDNTYAVGQFGQIDECGIWSRELNGTEIAQISNRYSPFQTLFYNNAQLDGDWGNILNWWSDSGFSLQAVVLPTSTNPINLYNEVTQNTQGGDQCFCSSASFWSANFGAGLTLQATGVVNMQGTSVMAGTTTDGVSMHDSSQLTDTSVIDGNVSMRDSSRAFGTIIGNATIYYDGGNGQYPIGGTVGGTVTYLGWPAVSPQWFNDQATGGGNDGDFNNPANWWSNNTYTTRPINAEGTQELPDASTDVFIAPNTGIVANTGTANPTINSVTANNSNIQNISITATNGFLFSGNEGVANAVLYGNVVFQDTAYNDHAVIQGKATYKSAASLQYSWGQNSLGNVNYGMYNGSTSFEVNISSGGGSGNKGFISRLLNLPWFINI